MNLNFQHHAKPFDHWIADQFIDAEKVRELNAEWPASDDERWCKEQASNTYKNALQFPRRLPDAAQALAARLFEPDVCAFLSTLINVELQPDPWFVDGPLMPRVGGGLHEIGPGGFLKIHVDFNRHPAGLERAANLLLYLNETWEPEWGGALELHGEGNVASIMPLGGRAVFFPTHERSWHGHPDPLKCPADRSRRSLAVYYYTVPEQLPGRKTTIYRSKN